jgi:hypothetical protein
MPYLKLTPHTADFEAMKEWFDGDSEFSVEDIIGDSFMFVVDDNFDADNLEIAIQEELNDDTTFQRYRFEFED